MKDRRPGLRRCVCASCQESFSSVTAFEKHRIGRHDKDRRCLGVGEMYEKGLRENDEGYWALEKMTERKWPQKAV